ncbi:hypothetical protein BTO30_11780 [Domibacillus antri]|uniref:STAS domain-containing protein n=1 Tax=Domibacillus antri TaxID=1714264 RepID=A0A1Q8Q3Y2_9BACI|nr:STAS domain-containing protein [Domibacillus antri]OLN22005.1 hypothetical protein BTO30_11780 [Domibacillus antri]
MDQEGAVQFGIEIVELMKTIRLYREVIWEFVEKELEIDNMVSSSILKINRIIDAVLDQTTYVFCVSYVKHHAKTIEAAQKAVHDISCPVVAISNDVAVLPLIGELTEERAGILMETVLHKSVGLRIRELIIDLSGVPVVNSMVANALNLIGVAATFTGIRPDIARTMFSLGIDFEKYRVKGTLKNALLKSDIHVIN